VWRYGKVAGAALIAFSLAHAGCGRTIRYSKPGGSYTDYMQDRDVCLRENMTAEALSSGTAYGAAASYGSAVRQCLQCGLFVSCMSMRDWQVDQDGFAPPEGGVVRCCK
jgi:hypothetical protein